MQFVSVPAGGAVVAVTSQDFRCRALVPPRAAPQCCCCGRTGADVAAGTNSFFWTDMDALTAGG